jgi:hypothetical protein
VGFFFPFSQRLDNLYPANRPPQKFSKEDSVAEYDSSVSCFTSDSRQNHRQKNHKKTWKTPEKSIPFTPNTKRLVSSSSHPRDFFLLSRPCDSLLVLS